MSHPIYGIVSKKAQNLYGWLDWDVVKILDRKENELSLAEILRCERLKKHEDDEENQTPVIVESDFAEAILQKRQKKEHESKYLNCRFLFPTSNILERFFSVAGYALNLFHLTQLLVSIIDWQEVFSSIIN